MMDKINDTMSADEQIQNERDLFAQAFISGDKELNELTLTWTGYGQILAAAATSVRREELKWVLSQSGNSFVGNGENTIKWNARNRLAALDSHPEEAV